MSTINEQIAAANAGLHTIKIQKRGDRLYLRGILPNKTGHGTSQQRISLGIYANPDGVKVALAQAQTAEADLTFDRWDWSKWIKSSAVSPKDSARELAKQFSEYKQGNIKAASFRANYLYPLESLPDVPLTESFLRSHVQGRSEPKTWTRKNDVMVFTALCKFHGIDVNLRDLGKGYKAEPVRTKDLPSDDEIVAIWESLKGSSWQWAYGVMATYGLRPHEIFAIVEPGEISSKTGKITIRENTKTGQRDVWPVPDAWREIFSLSVIKMPDIETEGRDNQQLSNRMSANLRGKIPHTPKSLRHAYAIRTAVKGVPDSIAARWMGHSIAVHASTYHNAISQLQHEAIWERTR